MAGTVEQNLFGALFQWGDIRRKEEDFFSKSLVLVLKQLRRSFPEVVADFLQDLFLEADFSIDDPFTLDVHDHVAASFAGRQRIPDLVFTSSSGTVFLEVKVRSGVDFDQLRDYREELGSSEYPGRKALFLLTLTGLTLAGKGRQTDADAEVSWIRVWTLLRQIPARLVVRRGPSWADTGYIARLIREYCKFLEESGMGVEQVSTIPTEQDARNVQLYLALVKAACEQAGLKNADLDIEPPEDGEPGWMGWRFKDRQNAREPQYACGFYLDAPCTLVFSVHDQARARWAASSLREGWEEDVERTAAETKIQLPQGFSSFEPERQLTHILDWVEQKVAQTA